jgi:hypothetical protein
MDERQEDIIEALYSQPRPQEFSPSWRHNKTGECIEFLLAPDSFYAVNISDDITVYYSYETGNVVGGLLKGFPSPE